MIAGCAPAPALAAPWPRLEAPAMARACAAAGVARASGDGSLGVQNAGCCQQAGADNGASSRCGWCWRWF